MERVMSYNRYACDADNVPDEVIKEVLVNCTEVIFCAGRYNYFKYGEIIPRGYEWRLPLDRAFPLIGITPEMLWPVFGCRDVHSYEGLGSFEISHKPFQELARILGKSVLVRREWGDNTCRYLFTAHPSGEIVDAV